MKFVAYLRVSTDLQAEKGLGLDVQEQQIREWAKRNKHVVVAWYKDEGQSGGNGLDSRFGLAEALRVLRDGGARGLVVYRLDRLARDVVLQEQLLREVWNVGTQICTTSDSEAHYLSDDPNDPSRELIRTVLSAVNQYERKMIALRMKGGRRRKAELGGYAYGGPPLGYRAQDRALVPDEEGQRTVKRILERRAEGASLRQIADTLATEGFQPARSDRWHPSSIRKVLQRAHDKLLVP